MKYRGDIKLNISKLFREASNNLNYCICSKKEKLYCAFEMSKIKTHH